MITVLRAALRFREGPLDRLVAIARGGAGLLLSAGGDPVVERAVGRWVADLVNLGRPLLWGVISSGRTAGYARLPAERDGAEFRPRFDSILYSAGPDFYVADSRLRWWETRHFRQLIIEGRVDG